MVITYTIDSRPAYTLVSGMLDQALKQITYWFIPIRTGNTKCHNKRTRRNAKHVT